MPCKYEIRETKEGLSEHIHRAFKGAGDKVRSAFRKEEAYEVRYYWD